jgi:tetratricopeptide (TPR) repeat protein
MNNLATAYLSAGRLADALPLLESTLKGQKAALGPDHPDTLITVGNVAIAHRNAGRLDDALPFFVEALKGQEAALGRDHPDTMMSRNDLAVTYEELKRPADALPLWREQLAQRRKLERPDSLILSGDLMALGFNLENRAKWEEADSVWRECLTIREKSAPGAFSTFEAMSHLGWSLLGQGKFAAAEPLIVKGYQGMNANEEARHGLVRALVLDAGERVVRLYERWGKPEKVAEWKSTLGLGDLPNEVFGPR